VDRNSPIHYNHRQQAAQPQPQPQPQRRPTAANLKFRVGGRPPQPHRTAAATAAAVAAETAAATAAVTVAAPDEARPEISVAAGGTFA
jgi:hypothetical protein